VQQADPSRCIGCRNCVYARPFGVPKFDVQARLMKKCNPHPLPVHIPFAGSDRLSLFLHSYSTIRFSPQHNHWTRRWCHCWLPQPCSDRVNNGWTSTGGWSHMAASHCRRAFTGTDSGGDGVTQGTTPTCRCDDSDYLARYSTTTLATSPAHRSGDTSHPTSHCYQPSSRYPISSMEASERID